jgi:transcription antitermination protein NusB
MARRSRAREIALQVLFQDDLNPRNNPASGDELLRRRLKSEPLIAFAQELVAGVRLHRQELDTLLEQTAANWSLGRMAATDRNVLRVGAYEILYCDTPKRVAINEAIDLAKRYGTAQSAQFVNGILDRVMHREGEKE